MVKGGDRRGSVPAHGFMPELVAQLRVFAATFSALFLAGCPQLLEDDFELARPGPDPNDMTPPTVVSVTPGDGFAGVPPDAVIVVTFSEPMDRESVENAYTSPDLPRSAVTFSWSENDTVLTIRPQAPLSVASGSDPDEVAAATYELELTSGAHDVSGNALVREHVEFSVIREITQTLDGVQQRSLTGNWRSDGVYGVSDCEESSTAVCIGDSPMAGTPAYRGFATFDLSELGEDIGVSAARLSVDVSEIVGDPFLDLGALAVDHVDFDEIGDAAFAATALSLVGTMASSADVGDTLGVDVVGPVNADVGERRRSQFRFSFSSETDADSVADVVICDWTSLELTVTYRTP
jgi:hypothetical protein